MTLAIMTASTLAWADTEIADAHAIMDEGGSRHRARGVLTAMLVLYISTRLPQKLHYVILSSREQQKDLYFHRADDQ